MTDLVHPHAAEPIHARIEWGHWLAACATPYCRTALRLEYGSGYLCPSCGVASDVIWPMPEDAAQIRELLRARPDPATRNWLPGETPMHLLAENAVHGVTSPRLVLDASGDRMRLQLLDEPATIGARAGLAIGA